MVKYRQYSGGSGDEPNHNVSCSAEVSPDVIKINGTSLNSFSANGISSGKVSKEESSLCNGNCVPAKENGVNGSYSNKISVNGHSDKVFVKDVPAVNANSSCAVSVNDAVKINGHCDGASAIIRIDENSGNCLNGSSTAAENGSCPSAQTSDSFNNEDNSVENQNGFKEVAYKKRRNRNQNKNQRWKHSPNLPPGPSIENIRHDNAKDNISDVKADISLTHLPQKPPSRNFAAVRSSGKTYSSVLANGQNGCPNISSNAQNVPNCGTSQNSVNNSLSGSNISIEKLSTNLNKSVAISNSSAGLCKQNSEMVEMNDVSAQTDISSPIATSPSKKEFLNADQDVAHGSEKSSSPSDYVDIGDSDGSSNAAYSDSVDSNDSGRGDSEIIYDKNAPYCCEFPKEKTSQLIGKGGSFRYEIERKSGVKLWVYSLEDNKDLSIICMIGTGAQVEAAKATIKERFRHVTLRQWIGCNPINPPLSANYLPQLPVGIDFMGVVSCICDPNFFWVQQYGHPHFYQLEGLERNMSNHFNTVTDAPLVENPTIGSIIAVPGVRDGDNVKWIRGWIINIIPEDEKVVVRYLDHGGDHLVPISNIRPMRNDFFSMPFFAAQCCLYDILPAGGIWSDDARAEFTRLCNSSTRPPIVRVWCKSPECYFVSMFGYDSETNAQVDIATQLITKGFGVRPCLPATEFSSELQQ